MNNLFDLTGKVALVTGASSGLGVQFAKALGGQGAKVCLAARRLEKLEKVQEELKALGIEAFAVKCDVTNNDDIINMVKACEEKFGKIVNIGSIHSEVVMNNATWPVTAYATAKGGVKMLTKGLASEWAKSGITVNAIGPAYFESEMTQAIFNAGGLDPVENAYCPMGRAGKAGELDGAVIYFASDASTYTTGQILLVDGGWTTL